MNKKNIFRMVFEEECLRPEKLKEIQQETETFDGTWTLETFSINLHTSEGICKLKMILWRG